MADTIFSRSSASLKEAAISTHFARIAGATRTDSGMPTTAVLSGLGEQKCSRAFGARKFICDRQLRRGLCAVHSRQGRQAAGGRSSTCRAIAFSSRKSLLAELDRLNRRADASGNITAADDIQQQAYEVLLGGGVSKALDLSNEDSRTLEMYDTAKYHGGAKWNKVNRGRGGLYNAQASTIGKLLLQARRLCEAGCGYVTIHASYAGVWDMHADGNNLNMVDGMEAVGRF